jgi:hypothetical protein
MFRARGGRTCVHNRAMSPTPRPKDTLAGGSDRIRVRPRFSLRPYANRRPRTDRVERRCCCPATGAVQNAGSQVRESADGLTRHCPRCLRGSAFASADAGLGRRVRSEPPRLATSPAVGSWRGRCDYLGSAAVAVVGRDHAAGYQHPEDEQAARLDLALVPAESSEQRAHVFHSPVVKPPEPPSNCLIGGPILGLRGRCCRVLGPVRTTRGSGVAPAWTWRHRHLPRRARSPRRSPPAPRCYQLLKRERLGQTVIRTQVQPLDAVADRRRRGQHQDPPDRPAMRSATQTASPCTPGRSRSSTITS